jgi:uncharacterized protein (TIGR02145 family)
MRTQLTNVRANSIRPLLAATLGLALALTLSCSNDKDDGSDGNDGGSSPPSSVTKSTLTDSRDGKSYVTVKIGNQTWMAKNLNYAAEGSKCYDNDESYCEMYGRLYNWVTAMDIPTEYEDALYSAPAKRKGVCPAGWHIPGGAEWGVLMQSVNPNCSGSNSCNGAGKLLKATSGWANNGNGTDAYSFSALPGGQGDSGGRFGSAGYDGSWWSTSEDDAYDAYLRGMYSNSENALWTTSIRTISLVFGASRTEAVTA